MTRTVKWFATNSKCYYGLFTCDEHGLIKGVSELNRPKKADIMQSEL